MENKKKREHPAQIDNTDVELSEKNLEESAMEKVTGGAGPGGYRPPAPPPPINSCKEWQE